MLRVLCSLFYFPGYLSNLHPSCDLPIALLVGELDLSLCDDAIKVIFDTAWNNQSFPLLQQRQPAGV